MNSLEFMISSQTSAFSNAESECSALNAMFARIETAEDLSKVTNLMKEQSVTEVFLAMKKVENFIFNRDVEESECANIRIQAEVMSKQQWVDGGSSTVMKFPFKSMNIDVCQEMCFRVELSNEQLILRDTSCTRQLKKLCASKFAY